MSNIALSSNNSGNGTFTIASLGTNTDRTLTLPDATGTINVSGLANEVPAGSNTAPAIYSTGDNNTGLFFPAADTVAVTTGGTERMRIDSSGNVGIGTITPNSGLHLKQTNAGGDVTARIQNSSTAADSKATLYFTTTSNDAFNSAFVGSDRNNALILGSNTIERMRIDSTGYVGINTATPAVSLHVIGNAILEGTSPNIVLAETDTTDQDVRIRAQDGCTLFETVTDARAQVRENMRIDASGNLLVGNTAINGEEGLTIRPGVSAGAAQITFNRATTTSSSSVIIFRNALAAAGSIAHTNTTTTYNTSSDYRLKENIEPMQNALDIVAQLNPVTYTWKADGSVGQGFIAHELQAIVPDCVTGEKDAIDEDGNPEYQGIDTSFLVATLVKAIQEQQATIEALTSRIETLEAK